MAALTSIPVSCRSGSLLDLAEFRLESEEVYIDLYTRMFSHVERHMAAATDILPRDGNDEPPRAEAFTQSHRNLLTLYWLEKIDPKLPGIVKAELEAELAGGHQLHSLVANIADNVRLWLSEREPMKKEKTSRKYDHNGPETCNQKEKEESNSEEVDDTPHGFDDQADANFPLELKEQDFSDFANLALGKVDLFIEVKDEKEDVAEADLNEVDQAGDSDDCRLSDGDRYSCPACRKSFSQAIDFKRHKRSHASAIEYFRCAHCELTFVDAVSRRSHVESAHISVANSSDGVSQQVESHRTFNCDICSTKFETSALFKKHQRTHQQPAKIKRRPKSTGGRVGREPELQGGGSAVQCDICMKCFGRAKDMMKHRRIHTGERPYLCQVCGAAFTESTTLNRHVKAVHTKDKPFQCHICQMSFSISYSLTLHLRTHTGEKPFHCKSCEMSFATSTLLKSHTRVHTGEKPYQCSTCHKRFSSSSHLILHTRTHTGEKPFACDTCQKTFASSSTLSAHRKIHTGEKPHQCVVCRKAFIKFSTLKRHMKVHPKVD